MPHAYRTHQLAERVRSAGRWLALLTLLLITGCSTRFIYNQLDTLIVWKVGDYVSLRKDQKADLKEQLSDRLDYVRLNELPQLADILEETSLQVETGDVTRGMLDDGYVRLMALYDEFMLGIIPVSEWFLLSLSEEQVTELFENLEKLNQEMYEDYSGRTAEERRENRNKSAIKMTQKFTGRLREEQKELIENSLERMADSSEQWIVYQRAWQIRFRALIEDQPPSAEFHEELTLLFVYPRSLHSEEYRAIVDANRQIFNEMMVELLNGLDDNQRHRVIDKLDGYADTLNKLAAVD
jgi:FtsZ-interacting cell division protein YlmF